MKAGNEKEKKVRSTVVRAPQNRFYSKLRTSLRDTLSLILEFPVAVKPFYVFIAKVW
jgi:hypothetical protein